MAEPALAAEPTRVEPVDVTRAPGTGPGSLPTYVPADQSPREFTLRAVLLGSFLSIVFGMVNAYAGLKIGITVSASIPSAILSMSVLRGLLGRPPPRFLGAVGRWLFGRDTILENNAAHAVASTGESLAGGIIFTAPALIFLARDAQALGQKIPGPSQTLLFLLGLTGGLLGLLMMIPLRRYLMVEEHATLPFPEGTACAKVLIAGDRGGASAIPVLIGALVGAAFDGLTDLATAFRDTVTWTASSLHQATVSFQLNPLMLGVGYLIGLEASAIMLWGGLIGWVLLIPLFDWIAQAPAGLGASLAQLLSVPGLCAAADPCAVASWFGAHTLLCQAPHALGAGTAAACTPALDPDGLWSHYVRYVGAGGVAMGGFVSLTRALPVIGRSFSAGIKGFKRGSGERRARTDRDLPTWLTLAGSGAVGLALWLMPPFHLGLLEALLAVAFAFFFVVVSARMVGLIGTTSQPVSGMTIAALLVTAVILAHVRGPGIAPMIAAMTVGVVVCIAICLSGDLSQDLKTCTLVGGTPWVVQTGQMVGTLSAALRAGWVLWILDARYHLGSAALPAPQATLMATLVQGTFGGHLPWGLLLFGAGLALIAEAVGWGGLTFSIGLYLPMATSASFIFGGVIQWWLKRRHSRMLRPSASARRPPEPSSSDNEAAYKDADERATLLSSGMIAGYALMGIAVAFIGVAADQAAGHSFLRVFAWIEAHATLRSPGSGPLEDVLTLLPFAAITALLVWFAARQRQRHD
ncbi:MAG: OPT family oligopeptide transporter [Myxococcales bacterium]